MNRTATARMIGGGVTAAAQQQTRPARGGADMVPTGIAVRAYETDRKNLYKPIRVKPEEAQTVQWLTPGNVLEYQIITNFDWIII